MSALSSDALLDTQHRHSPAIRFFDEWINWLRMERKSARTIDAYERPVAKLLRENIDKELGDFTHGDVMAQIASYPEKSWRPMRVRIASFFNYVTLMGYVDRNPMDRVPKVRREQQKVIDTFEDWELALFFALDYRDAALFYILCDAGLRKQEACDLQWRHVSLQKAELVVERGKGDKGRVIPLTARAVFSLEELATLDGLNRDDHLWYSQPGGGKRISRRDPIAAPTFSRWYRACLETAGVRYRNPHVCRHTYATRAIRAGIPLGEVSDNLGHASIQTTEDLYVHLDLTDRKASITLLDDYNALVEQR